MAAWWASAQGAKGQAYTEPVAAPGAGSGGELTVSGCGTPSTAVVIHGSYAAASKKNHGRPVFQKCAPAGGADVFLYYWDERDGPTFHGWWLGPSVGADQVWAYCPGASPAPPASGWQVPYGGPVDAGLRVSAAAPAPQTVLPPAGQGQATTQPRVVPAAGPAAQQWQQQKVRPQQQWPQQQQQQQQQWQQQQPQQQPQQPPQQQPQQQWRQQPQQQWQQQQQAQQQWQQQQQARKQQPQQAQQAQQAQQRPPQQVQPRWQKGAAARPPAAGAHAWQQAAQPPRPAPPPKEPGALVAPVQVQLTMEEAAGLCAGNGRAVKRLAALTGCSIDAAGGWAPQAGGPGAFALRLSGGAKQRRLAAAALREAASGLDAEDALASAGGALVLPHDISHQGRREWLAWRVAALEHRGAAVPAEVTRGAVRVARAAGEGAGDEAAEAELRAALEAAVEEAQALSEDAVEAESELAPEAADAEVAIAPLAAQHGLLVRVRERADGPRVHVLGPPAAARDAAALLWARYAQGHATAAVLQAEGRVQQMEAQMAKDFERDLQDMEAECGVRVHQAETMLWVDGADAAAVQRARATLREMLQFYLPDEFLWLRGLKAPILERLGQDWALRAIAASPGCAMSLEREGAEGTAWLCGPRREEARKRIDVLARSG